MNKSINFLKKQASQIKVKQQRFLYVKIGLIIGLTVYVITVVLLILYSLILSKQQTVIQGQLTDTKKSIESLKSVESKQILLKNKTASLTEILVSQKQHQKLIETIFQLIPEGVMINGLNINQSGSVNFSAITQDLPLLTGFLNSLATYASEPKNQLKNITIESVMFSLQSGYSANINLFFSEDSND